MEKHELFRIKSIIQKSIDVLQLDLSNYTVLTEVGSNYFVFTPIIALMAKAKKVYAWSRDSRFGKAEENKTACDFILNEYNLPYNIEYALNERPITHLKNADIITNLGHIRPINEDLLKNISSEAAIAVMSEAWELRLTDVDASYCKKNGISIAGTWENHPDLKIFDGCGHLAIKMALNAGYEVYQNNIIIWSNDHFGRVISEAFLKFGAAMVIQTKDVDLLYEQIDCIDFIFFCDYHEQRNIIGQHGFLDLEKIKQKNRGFGVVHLYGSIDNEFIKKNELNVYPDKLGLPSVMTYTLAHLGAIPLINLHAAGLKVGECLKKNIYHTLVQKI